MSDLPSAIAAGSRPGGNLTGFALLSAQLDPKQLELLSELVPQAKVVGLLVNPNEVRHIDRYTRAMQDAARAKGRQLLPFETASANEIDAAFASLVHLHADALMVAGNSFFAQRRGQLVASAARYAVPVIYHLRSFVTASGLLSYGSRFRDLYRGAGTYVGRILAGAKPADLLVQQPTTFELVVNLKTAKALALAVPPSILARADEVIE